MTEAYDGGLDRMLLLESRPVAYIRTVKSASGVERCAGPGRVWRHR